MTKHQFLARLVRAPIQVEAISKLMCYRVAPHGERDPNAGVYLCLAPIGGELVVLDYAMVHAHIDGQDVKLSYRETERIAARLRRLFALGELPTRATLQGRRPRAR
jgi:hypothetical protein